MEETPSKRAPDRWSDDGHFSQTASSLERAGRVEELIRLLEERVRELPIGPEAAHLLTRAGELARDRLRDSPRAEDCFRRALLYAPGGKEAFKALSALLEQRQDYGALAELLEELAQTTAGQERASHLLRAADLHEQKLQRKDRAIFCCQRASRADPSARQAFRKCRQLLLADYRYRPAFDSLQRERAALGSAGLADDYAALAELLAEDPLEHPLAQSAARIALEIQPGHARAEKVQRALKVFDLSWRDQVRRLRTASLEERDRKSAARESLLVAKLFAWCDGTARNKVKEALHRSFLLWPGMPAALDFLDRLAAKENDVPGAIRSVQAMAREAKDRAVQSQLWTRAGLLRLQLEDRAGALEDFQMAAETDPSRPEGVGLAAEMLIEKGEVEEAFALYLRHLATIKDRRAQIDLRIWLAELGATMGRDDVSGHLQEVLKSDRTNTRAARRLAQSAIETADPEALEPVLELALVGAAEPARVALALAAAQLFEEKGDPARALAVLRRVSVGRPPDERLTAAMAAISSRRRPTREVGDWLQRAAQTSPPEAASTPLPRALADLLQRANVDSGAQNGSAPTTDGRAAGSQLEALERSANALISSAKWDDAAKSIQSLLSAPGADQGARMRWTVKLAQIYADRQSQPDRAVALLLPLLQSVPSHDVLVGLERLASRGVHAWEISEALARHYETAGDHHRQAAALLVGLSAAKEPRLQKQLLRTLAAIHETHLADTRAAFDFIVRAMQIEPLDAEVRGEAVRLASDLSSQADLARALTACAQRCDEPAGARELFCAAAELAEAAGAVDEAVSALKAGLERSADDAQMLAHLAHLYEKSGRLPECEELLRRSVARAEGGQKGPIYLELAQLSVKMGRPADAAQAVRSAIDAGAEQRRYLPWLCDLLEQAGRMSELSAALGQAIAVANGAGDHDQAARLSLRRAKVSEASLSDRAEAVRSYAEILQRRPLDPDAIAALESLLSESECREEAARALIPAYEALKDHRKLVTALDAVAQCAADQLDQVRALKHLAHVYQHQLRQPDLAFATLARALRLAPDDATLRAAARQIADDADCLDSLAEVLEKILHDAAGGPRAALHRELADLYEKKLEDPKSAIRHWLAGLELEPANLDALRALRRLQRRMADWPGLARAVEILASSTADPAEKAASWRELAVLCEEKLNDKNAAAAAWRQLSALDPRDREAASALQRLYGELNRREDLAYALGLRLSQEGQSPQGLEAAAQLARLRRELGEKSAALQLYRQILMADPNHAGARGALEAWVGVSEAESTSALQILDPVLAVETDHPRRIALRETRMESAPAEEKSQLAAEIRAIYERDMRQPDLAFRSACEAFAAGIDREAARQEMERLARLTGAYEHLADAYQAAAEAVAADDGAALPLIRRGAQLREHLGQADYATRLWQHLLELSPNDREALEHLSGQFERSKDAHSLAELLVRQAELAEAAEEKQLLWLKAGAAFAAANADARGIDAFRSALAVSKSALALEGLERLYERGGRGAEQAEVLEQLAEISTDPLARRAHLARRAELLERGQPLQALRAYRQLLELSPADGAAVAGLERLLAVDSCRVEAASLLEAIYRQLKDVKGLAEVLQINLESAAAGDRSAIVEEIANLREHLGDKSAALDARIQLFRQEPDSEAVRGELERLAAETGSFDALASAYEEQLGRKTAEPRAEMLWRRLASLYGERLGRIDAAIRAWQQVLARQPKDAQVLDSVARLYRQSGAFGPLAAVMKEQIALEPNARQQVSHLFELARLAEESLSDRALAASAYEQILEREPDEPNALKLLERVLSQTERWADLAALIEREIRLAEQRSAREESLDLRVRLGRLKLTRLGDPPGALAIFAEVLRLKTGHAGALAALEEMARSDGPLRAEAAAALEPLFAAAGDHLRLVQMLESLASAEPALKARVALLRRVADVYAGPMKNAEMAFVAAARALRELPDDEASLELCLKLVDAAEATDDLVALLVEIASKASDDGARASLYRALGRLRQRQRDPAGALETWRRVLELSPADEEALDALARLYALLGRGRELLEVLRRQLAATEEPSRRALLLLQIGTLQEEHLKDNLGALATFRLLLELRPEDTVALERMDLLTEKLQRWPELADVLSRRLGREGQGGGADLKFRLAVVRESRLMDKLGAVQLYAEILSAQPDHADALLRLEGILERDPKNRAAAAALLKALRASGDATKLAEALERRIGASDAAERKALLLELAQIRAAQNEPELEYLARYRAFKDDPNDSSLRDALEGAADAAGSWEELTHAYEEELPRIAEAVDAGEVCLRLATVLEEKLGQADRAALYYEKARGLNPQLDARILPALERLYTQLGKPEQLAGVLEFLVGKTDEPSAKAALFFRIGGLCQEHLGDLGRATRAYEQALELDPTHLGAAQLLEQLYQAAGNNDRLYAVLRLQRDSATGAERERILSKMAEVSAEGLSDVAQSIDLYRELLAKNPRNEQAYASLEQLLERDGRFEELAELLARRVRLAVEPRELARVSDKLGRTLHLKLGRGKEAIAHFKAALDRDPRHAPALESLRTLYEELGRKEDLAAVLRRLLPLQENNEGVRGVRVRLAELLGELSRREEALDAGRRAMEIEPHRPAELNRLYQVFSALNAHADAVRALELRAQAELESDERDRAVATFFEISDLWKGPGHKPENAGPALVKILELDPANRTAYERARDLFAELLDWRSYAEVIDRHLPQVVTDEEKLEVLRELAKVREHKLGQKDVAFLAVCRALQLNPAVDELRDEVERLADATGSHEELAAVYEQVAGELPHSALAERIYLALARLQDEKLDDPAGAEASLRQILEFDPTSALALESLSQLFARRGRDQDYAVALEQRVEATADLEQRKQLLWECARVYEERLGDPGEAAGALLRALDLHPDRKTFELLIGFFKRQRAWVDVAHTLLRSRDLADSSEERARIQVEIAQVYERELRQDDEATAAYQEALEIDPSNREAIEALERLYTKLDRPAELLSIYDKTIELSSDYRERVSVLFRSASIWEDKFQNAANADACIDGVLAIDPHNVQAIRQLERLRRAQGRWEELVSVLERHVQLSTSAEEQSELAVAIGDVFYHQLRQVDRAAKQYDRALELNPTNVEAMHGLGTLYERSGNWPFSLEMLQREAEVVGAGESAAELHYRMGKINEEMLVDVAAAKTCYLRAVEMAPSHLPSIRALKAIYESEGDWDAFQKALIDEAQNTEDSQQKSQVLCEVGNYIAEKREDLEAAAQWYEEALQYAPGSIEVARRLADIYVGRESWEKSERMLEVVIAGMNERLAAGEDGELAAELCRQLYRFGYVAEKLGDKAKALSAYEQAYRVDATYLPALEGLGNLLVQANRLEEALKVYQTILIHHREDLTDLEVVEIYWQLGETHASLGQGDRAKNHFEKALSIDPGHEPSLRALAKIADAADRFDKSAEYRQRLLQVLEGDDKFDVCIELGNLARAKLSDAHVAIDAYLAAHKIRPDDLAVMDALYILYRETRQGKRAAEVLGRILKVPELQKDAQRAKRVYFALGEITRDALGEVEPAVAAFNSALDLDPRFVEAFSAIEALLSAKKQWKQLEENYARMIQRLTKSEETHVARMALWRALGELYREVIKNPESALMAYQVVAAGLPEDAVVQEIYAELVSQKDGEEEKAVVALRRALPNTERPEKICSSLAELAARLKQYDLAYMAAQTVQGFFQQVGPGEREILTKLTPYAKKREIAQQPLSDRLWKMHLLHPKVRGPIGELMAILFEQLGHHLAVPLSHYQVNPKKHRIDVPAAQEYHIHHYRYVARLLGMEAVEVYSPFLVATRERLHKKSNEPVPEPLVGIEICQTHPPCLKIGGKFFSEPAQREVYYLIGRTLALLRAELALSQRLAPARLEALFQAAISLSVPNFRVTADRRAVDAERALLERSFAEPARVALDRASREYIRAGALTSIADYLQGAELTAARAGLFVAGEVEAAKKMVTGERGAAYRVDVEAKLRDLISFAVSDDLQALRTAAGNRIEVQLRR